MIQALVLALLVLLFLGAAIIVLWLFFGDDGKPDAFEDWISGYDSKRSYDDLISELDAAGPDAKP